MIPEARSANVGPSVVGGAAAPGGTVTVPGPRVVESTGQAIESVRDERTTYLNTLAEPLRKAGLDVEVLVAFGWDAAEEIVKASRDLDVDVICMATHGRTALGKIVFGSVAEAVMRAADRPILTVRPRGLRSQ
jgi:nucleotide-binding universal stress UspA family protein